MAQGNAAKVRRYVCQQANEARSSGEPLNLSGDAVLTDINLALQTQKLEREAKLEFMHMTGLGRASVYRFRVMPL